jgi:hypothetical protein
MFDDSSLSRTTSTGARPESAATPQWASARKATREWDPGSAGAWQWAVSMVRGVRGRKAAPSAKR